MNDTDQPADPTPEPVCANCGRVLSAHQRVPSVENEAVRICPIHLWEELKGAAL